MQTEELLNKKIKDLVQETPAFTTVMNKYGFDFCCGGNKTLNDTCREFGLSPEQVLQDMKSILESKNGTKNVDQLPTLDLIQHILKTHHEYLKSALPEIEFFSNKVANRHGGHHPELIEVNKIYMSLKSELDSHLMKEEEILFPLIKDLSDCLKDGSKIGQVHCGSVNNPIRVMNFEHDTAKEHLEKLKKLTDGYNPPADACNSYRILFTKLAEMEKDLLEHIRLEENLLFPQAKDLELKVS